MLIEKATLKNYRRFSEVTVDFHKGMNLIVGVNGAGKTSLLKGIFSSLPYFFATEVAQARPQQKDVHKKIVGYQNGYRAEPQYPMQLFVKLTEASATGMLTEHVGFSMKDASGQLSFFGTYRGLAEWRDSESIWPVMAFYEAFRFHSSPSSPVSLNLAVENRSDGYRDCLSNNYEQLSATVLSWIATKSMERTQRAMEQQRKFREIDDDELQQLISALRETFPEFDTIFYDWHTKRILSVWKDAAQGERVVAFEDFSDGERGVVLLYADIVRRMCLMNPQLGTEVIKRTDGFVFIDELDVHLHPDWQRKVIVGLTKSFPEVQFFVTTHSPQIIGEVPAEQIILLDNGEIRRVDQSQGLTSDEVLVKVMGATDKNHESERLDSEIRKLVDSGQLAEAEKKLEALRRYLKGDTELTFDLENLVAFGSPFDEDNQS